MDGRRQFLKRAASALGLGWLGYRSLDEWLLQGRAWGALQASGVAPEKLDAFSRPARFFDRGGALVTCRLCPHECALAEGERGFCRVRAVKGGQLYSLAYGNLCALRVDPIEKKPLFHFLPETYVVSVAMGGCNMRCANCQNWEISQAEPERVARFEMLPAALVQHCQAQQSPSLAFTYTEPLMAYEYVRDTAQLARAQGIKTVLVTAGLIEERPLRELCRGIDAVTLDVKAFREQFYREVCRGKLRPVLRTLEVLREEGVWVEVSALMVSTMSDEPKEIGQFAKWLVEHLGPDTPLHLLRFHPSHKLTHLPLTALSRMHEARGEAKAQGLRYVYLGNAGAGDFTQTRCPKDGQLLIERRGYEVVTNRLEQGKCPSCGTLIAGVFAR